MYIAGLQLGFSSQDLRYMPYHNLRAFLEEWADMNAPQNEKQATAQDVKRILG